MVSIEYPRLGRHSRRSTHCSARIDVCADANAICIAQLTRLDSLFSVVLSLREALIPTSAIARATSVSKMDGIASLILVVDLQVLESMVDGSEATRSL